MNMSTKTKLIKDVAAITLISSPLFAAAQATVNSLINTFKGILGAVIPFFMILATVIFLWGVIQYITAGGEEEKIKAGRTYMLWGIIGLFVMIAVWGLVNVLATTLGIGTNNTIPPGVQP